MKINCTTLLLISIVLQSAVYAQKASKPPGADVIFSNVVKGFEKVRDFTAAIDAEVKMDRVQIPKMTALLYFKKPDKIHFSSQGFLLVPREGIALNPAVLWERYDASYIGQDTIEGRKLYKLQLAAKAKETRLRQLYTWIEPSNWTIAKIETIPYEGRTLSMVFAYEFIQGEFWLPSKMTVSFGSVTEGEKPISDSVSQSNEQFGQMQRSIPRNGSVTVLYSNYKVNIGLDDAIFEKKENSR
jgi:outer membrane lipoprotein-sorting protein